MKAGAAIGFLRRRKLLDWAVLLLMLLACGVAGHFLAKSRTLISVRSGIYQATTLLPRTARLPRSTVTVLLNDADFWSEGLSARVPTRRDYLAKQVDRLATEGAAVIALDFDLRSPGPGTADFSVYQAENAALFQAIRAACAGGHRVVLATELLPGPAEVNSIYSAVPFPDECMRRGYIQLPLDIRRAPGVVPLSDSASFDSFALAAVAQRDKKKYNEIVAEDDTDFSYSLFMPESSFRDDPEGQNVFTGDQILTGDTRAFTGRIVVVGADWHTLPGGRGSYVDRHPSPAGSLPGVLLHANYIEAALDGKLKKPFPDALGEALDALLVLVLAGVGMMEIHARWKWLTVGLTFVFVVTFSYLLLQTFGYVLDFFFPLIFLGLHALYEHVHEWRHPGHER